MKSENAHHPWCPLDFVLDLISGRWTIPIIRELRGGAKRPSELNRALPKISAKTLTHRLRELEGAGFILRESFEEIPPRVVYSLTAKGEDLMSVLEALNELGQNWQDALSSEKRSAAQTCKHCDNVRMLEAAPVVVPKDLKARTKPFEKSEIAEDNRSSLRSSKDSEADQEDSFFTFQPGDERRVLYAQRGYFSSPTCKVNARNASSADSSNSIKRS